MDPVSSFLTLHHNDFERDCWSGARGADNEARAAFPDLPTPQSLSSLFCIESEWFVVGGFDTSCTSCSTLKLTNQGGSWSWEIAQLPRVNDCAVVAEHEGWLFVDGGYESPAERASTVECVDTRNGEAVSFAFPATRV